MEDELEQYGRGGAGWLLRAVWRRWWWLPPICLVIVVGPLLAHIRWFRESVYVARSLVTLDIQSRPARVLGVPDIETPVNIASERAIMETAAIVDRGAQALESAGADRAWLQDIKLDIPKGSRVMSITARGPTAETARDLANALADAYVDHRRRSRQEAANETLAWLTGKLDDAKYELQSKEQSFLEFRRDRGVPSLESKREADIQRYQTLSEAYLQAHGRLLDAEAELRTLSNQDPGGSHALPGASEKTAQPGGEKTRKASGEILKENPFTIARLEDKAKRLRNEYDEKRSEIRRHAKMLKENHPTIARLEKEAERLRNEYDVVKERVERGHVTMLKRRVQVLRDEDERAKRALDRWRTEALAISDDAVEYRIRERETQVAQETYNMIASKIRELRLISRSGDETTSVLERAQLGELVPPPDTRNVALAVMGALALATMASIALEKRDTTIRSPADVERYLGLPIVALIPNVPEREKRRERLERRQRKALAAPRGSAA